MFVVHQLVQLMQLMQLVRLAQRAVPVSIRYRCVRRTRLRRPRSAHQQSATCLMSHTSLLETGKGAPYLTTFASVSTQTDFHQSNTNPRKKNYVTL